MIINFVTPYAPLAGANTAILSGASVQNRKKICLKNLLELNDGTTKVILNA